MSQLDELELGKTLGRVEQKVDSVIAHVGELKNGFAKELNKHDVHIQTLLSERSEKKGASHVWYLVYSFCAIGFWKLVEHAPSFFKSLIS